MSIFRRSPERIHGYVIPAPRFTRQALVYFIKYAVAPVLLILLALDLGLFFLFRNVFGLCYGVACLWN